MIVLDSNYGICRTIDCIGTPDQAGVNNSAPTVSHVVRGNSLLVEQIGEAKLSESIR